MMFCYDPGLTQITEDWLSLKVPDDIQILSSLREYLTYAWLSYQDAAKQFFLQAMKKLFCNCLQDCDVGRMNE